MGFTNGVSPNVKIDKETGEVIRIKPKLICKDKSLTVQDEKDACDINLIIERFTKTGLLTHVNRAEPRYGDFSDVKDYSTALQQISKAKDDFMALPSRVRKFFDNDPQKIIEFVQDDKNYEKCIELGLIDDEKSQAFLQKKREISKKVKNERNEALKKAIAEVKSQEIDG